MLEPIVVNRLAGDQRIQKFWNAAGAPASCVENVLPDAVFMAWPTILFREMGFNASTTTEGEHWPIGA